MSFLVYDPLSPAPRTATGTISLGCAGLGLLPDATVALTSGSSGSFAMRTMKLTGSSLNYNLFTETDYGSIWGDGSPGTATKKFQALLLLGSVNLSVHGRIPAGQDAKPGLYSDTITVNVEF